MVTTLDAAGRLVVPKEMRDHLGLAPGVEVEVEERDGSIVIVPRRVSTLVEGDDGLPLLVAPADTPAVTAQDVRAVLERLRR